jgi:hypothetical protein
VCYSDLTMELVAVKAAWMLLKLLLNPWLLLSCPAIGYVISMFSIYCVIVVDIAIFFSGLFVVYIYRF